MATTSQDIQNLIDAKVSLIQGLIVQIAAVTANPKPTYTIDGQSVDWNTYMSNLTTMQATEIDCLKKLYELQNIIQPYQFQSSGGGCAWGSNW